MMITIKQERFVKLRTLAACALAFSAVPRLSATNVYAANPNTGQLQLIDSVANTTTTVFPDAAAPRGLVFTSPTDIVYTTLAPGRLNDYNLNTHTSSLLTTFGTNQFGQYLALDPGGASLLFGVAGTGIERFNLTTHAVTTVSNFFDPRGLAYDAAGHLFAVLGSNEVAQIDPVSGTVIASITLPNSGSAGANGLTFDPVTGQLFVTDDINDLSTRGLYQISTALTNPILWNAGLLANGLTADGQGNLWIAESNHLDEYNTTSHTLTTGTVSPGMFDVAIAPSSAPPSNTPEPASLLLLGCGLSAIGFLRKRHSKLRENN